MTNDQRRREQKRARRVRRHVRPPVPVSVPPVDVLADYRLTDGQWWVTVSACGGDGNPMAAEFGPADSVPAVYELAMGVVSEIVEEYDRPAATVHVLNGDPFAWVAMAQVHGMLL